MKNILCFGDSNTWGYTPGTAVRYAQDVRYTGVMQAALGSDYRILEDGLNARTTVYEDPWSPWRLGKEALPIALVAQKPLDLLVLMLGTNDLMHSHKAWEASRGCITLSRMVMNGALHFNAHTPRLLLVSPIHIGREIAETDQSPLSVSGYEESLKFAPLYEQAAARIGIDFLDAAKYAEPSPVDNEHMDAEGHAALAAAIADKLKTMLG